jgi:hypothetical protein
MVVWALDQKHGAAVLADPGGCPGQLGRIPSLAVVLFLGIFVPFLVLRRDYVDYYLDSFE